MRPPRSAVDAAVKALEAPDGEGCMLLVLPRGLPANARAALLSNVGDLAGALRERGVPAKAMRVDGHELERLDVADSAKLEALFVLYVGDKPELPS